MKRAAILALACAFPVVASGVRADAPLRHLVYSFTYESSEHGAVTNDPGTSGAHSYTGKLDDSGTISVDVLREAADRGLVVVVSEAGQYTRRAPAATCAVYGNTSVVCDPNKHLNSEEYTLLRFLGANFFDPNVLDAKQHWSISQRKGASALTADYVVLRNDDGVMTISETRHVDDTSQGSTTFNTEAKVDYNVKRLLPISIDDYTTEDRHGGVLGVSSTTYQTTLKLVSDSMAPR